MTRTATIVAVVALLVGLLGGYLWWGTTSQGLRKDLADARADAQAAQAQAEAARHSGDEKIKALGKRVGELETDLAQEKQRRSRLEGILSKAKGS